MVSRESALKGRSETMSVSPTHYVLKTLMKAPWPQGMKTLVVANGCFWGSEKGMWRLPGVYSTAVGYSGGFTPNPTYQEVCSGNTGHTESVQVVYDPARISVVDLLRWHWESHDPCQGMGQGNDRGTQYRSAIYFFDDEQRVRAQAHLTHAAGTPYVHACVHPHLHKHPRVRRRAAPWLWNGGVKWGQRGGPAPHARAAAVREERMPNGKGPERRCGVGTCLVQQAFVPSRAAAPSALVCPTLALPSLPPSFAGFRGDFLSDLL